MLQRNACSCKLDWVEDEKGNLVADDCARCIPRGYIESDEAFEEIEDDDLDDDDDDSWLDDDDLDDDDDEEDYYDDDDCDDDEEYEEEECV